MSNVRESYPEIGNIQDNFTSLKNNTVDLARHVKEDGSIQTSIMSDKAGKMYDRLKVKGVQQFERAEVLVKEKPAKSMAIAFAVGAVASYLLGRK